VPLSTFLNSPVDVVVVWYVALAREAFAAYFVLKAEGSKMMKHSNLFIYITPNASTVASRFS
jgi:hypothetical protein